MMPGDRGLPRGAGGWAIGPMLTSVAASGASAATTLFIARGIGAGEFGRYTVVLTIALIVTVGMLMSLNYVMYQELPRAEPAERPALTTTALVCTLIVGAGVTVTGLLAAPVLTAVLGVDLRTLCFGLALGLAMTLNQLTESFLRGLTRFRFVATLKLVVALAYLAGSSCCLLLVGIRDADFYLTALIITNVVFAAAAVANVETARGVWSSTLARSLYRHGAYVTATAALTAILFGVDVILLNRWSDRVDVGVYSIYNGFPKRLLGVVFTEGIGLVLLPTMALLDKPRLLRRIGRLAPAVFAGAAVLSFVASVLFFLLLRDEYPYSFGLMAASAVGIGAHSVFNLYFFALSMDGIRGAKVFLACLAIGSPVALACQAILIAEGGLAGAMAAFPLTNLILIAIVAATVFRSYRSEVPR